jgi:hypothetical protein
MPRQGNAITQELTFDLRVPVFAALVALVTMFAFGLWPRSRRRGPCELIRSRLGYE